jgi:hypothetical protein
VWKRKKQSQFFLEKNVSIVYVFIDLGVFFLKLIADILFLYSFSSGLYNQYGEKVHTEEM